MSLPLPALFLEDLLDRPRWWLGFSGGLDSTVLLHRVVDYLAHTAHSRRPALVAVHVNHGLSPDADDWQRHCEGVCAALGVPCESVAVRVDIDARGGLEAAARRARYAVFSARQQREDVLLLGHHSDDQVETLLLRLFRSTGIDGLAGMRQRTWVDGRLRVRPLLDCSREQLHDYAVSQGLRWIEDESNTDQSLSRNFVRHRVLPLLADHWPQCRRQLLALARSAAESAELLREIAHQDLAAIAASDRWGNKLELDALKRLSQVRIRNALTRWLHAMGVPSPRQRQWPLLFEQMLVQAERSPELRLHGGSLRRYRDALYWVPETIRLARAEKPWQSETNLIWNLEAPLSLDGGMALCATLDSLSGGLLPGCYRLAFRGDCANARQNRSLKRALAAAGVPPWWRDRVPLLYRVSTDAEVLAGSKEAPAAQLPADAELAAIADIWIAPRWRSVEGQPGYRLRWS